MAWKSRPPAPGQPSRGPEPDGAQNDPESVARIVCLRLLERRPHTRSELEAALVKRGLPEDAAQAVLDRFTQVGLVDDAAFARAWVESRHRVRGLARSALVQELRQRGVAAEHIEAAVADIDSDGEAATALALARRKLRSLAHVPVEAKTRRLVGMLARKGYGPGVAYRVVREALGEECPMQTEDDSAARGES